MITFATVLVLILLVVACVLRNAPSVEERSQNLQDRAEQLAAELIDSETGDITLADFSKADGPGLYSAAFAAYCAAGNRICLTYVRPGESNCTWVLDADTCLEPAVIGHFIETYNAIARNGYEVSIWGEAVGDVSRTDIRSHIAA